MARTKLTVSPAKQEQQSFNDVAQTRKVSEAGLNTQLGITPNAASVDVPANRALILVNTDTAVHFLRRGVEAAAATAPTSIATAHIAVPPNSMLVWNTGDSFGRAGDVVSIRTDSATLAVFVSEETYS